MHIKLIEMTIIEPGMRPPGENSRQGHFTTSKGYDIDYNTESSLITVTKGGYSRSVHVSRVGEMTLPKEEPKPKYEIESPALKR